MARGSITRHAIYNIAGTVSPLLVTLVTLPLYLREIGEARYGILALAWALLGLFAFFDFGFSRAASNAIARLREAPDHARSEILWTAMVVNAGLGIAGGLLLWLASSSIIRHGLGLSADLQAEVSRALPWLAAAVPLAASTAVMNGALVGRERFLALNFLRVASATAFQITPLLAALAIGPSLAIVLPAAVLARGITLAAYVVAAFQAVPARRPAPSLRIARRLFSYGGWVTVNSLLVPLMGAIDRFAVAGVLGAEAVARYAVPVVLSERIQLLPIALGQALFPRVSGLVGGDATKLSERAARTISVILTVICSPMILIARPFLEFLLGAEFAADAAPVMQIILLGAWAAGHSNVPSIFLFGQGRPRAVALIRSMEVLPYLAGVAAGVYFFGLPGVAIAWSLKAAADTALLYAESGILIDWRYVLLPEVFLLAASFAVALAEPQPAVAILCAAAAGAAAVAWGLVVDPTLRALALGLARRRPA